MTLEELKKYYVDLLIIQYRSKTKARGHIEAMVSPFLCDLLPLAVRDGFDLNVCTGVQLDVIGKYVGADRIITGPNSLKVSLNDDDYRVLIKLAIVKNNSTSSLYEIQTLLNKFFGKLILATDNATMQINYFINSDIGSSDLQYAIVYGNLLPKPMGVQTSCIVVPPFTSNYFGFRTYITAGTNIAPFNSYSFYHTDYPWLSYPT